MPQGEVEPGSSQMPVRWRMGGLEFMPWDRKLLEALKQGIPTVRSHCRQIALEAGREWTAAGRATIDLGVRCPG